MMKRLRTIVVLVAGTLILMCACVAIASPPSSRATPTPTTGPQRAAPTIAVSTATSLPQTATHILPAVTVALPTATPVPPTSTRPPTTATPLPPTATRPAPTATPVPPTATRPAATSTPIPPAATSAPVASACPQGCTEQKPGCDIKGNINSEGVKIYHTRASSSYSRTEIDPSKGERWFCTEAEARAAGWRAPL